MMNTKTIVRLYRLCSERDARNDFFLTSSTRARLSPSKALEEAVSHELNASTKRRVFFSTSISLEHVKKYQSRHPEGIEVRFIDIDLSNPPSSLIDIYPMYDRLFLLNLLAQSKDILERGYVKNPATKREHTILGLLAYSERSVAGWAHSLLEVMLHVNGLQFRPLSEMKTVISMEDSETALRQYCLQQVPLSNTNLLREYIKDAHCKANLKRHALIDLVNGNDWYKSA